MALINRMIVVMDMGLSPVFCLEVPMRPVTVRHGSMVVAMAVGRR
jgi:hypothetical protein